MMLVLLCIIAAALLSGLVVVLDAYARYLRHAANLERMLDDMATQLPPAADDNQAKGGKYG